MQSVRRNGFSRMLSARRAHSSRRPRWPRARSCSPSAPTRSATSPIGAPSSQRPRNALSAAQAQADLKTDELTRRDQSVADREVHAKQLQEDLKAARDAELAALERVAGHDRLRRP